jgi:hypothetical protein
VSIHPYFLRVSNPLPVIPPKQETKKIVKARTTGEISLLSHSKFGPARNMNKKINKPINPPIVRIYAYTMANFGFTKLVEAIKKINTNVSYNLINFFLLYRMLK